MTAGFINKEGAFCQFPQLLLNSDQCIQVQPVKGGYQFDLLVMAVLERLAGHSMRGANHHRRLIEPEGSTAVVNRCGANPFQCVSITDSAKIILVPVLIHNKVIQHQHSVKAVPDTGDALFLAAVQIVLINRNMVGLRLGLHDVPRCHKLCVRGNEVLTYAVWIVLLHGQGIGHMGNPQALHDDTRQHLIIRLLLGRAASGFQQAALSVHNRPLLFQPAIRGIVRRHQADSLSRHRMTEQGVAHVL